MTKSQRLRRIAKLSDTEERVAAQNLAEAHEVLQRGQQQLREMTAYRREYQAQLNELNAVMDGAEARRLTEFLQRIDQVIAELESKLSGAEEHYGQCRIEWLQRRKRGRALGEIITRTATQEAQRHAQVEQVELDDQHGRKR